MRGVNFRARVGNPDPLLRFTMGGEPMCAVDNFKSTLLKFEIVGELPRGIVE